MTSSIAKSELLFIYLFYFLPNLLTAYSSVSVHEHRMKSTVDLLLQQGSKLCCQTSHNILLETAQKLLMTV